MNDLLDSRWLPTKNKPISECFNAFLIVGLWQFANGNEVFGHYSQTKVPLKDDEVIWRKTNK